MNRIFAGIVILLAAAWLPAPVSADPADSSQELQRIQQELKAKKQDIRRAGKKERSILTELDSIDRAIQAGSTELILQRKTLEEAEAALREIEQGNAGLAEELKRLKERYRERVRALFKMERTGGFALAVLAADDFSIALKRTRYLGIIAERDGRLIREYANALDRLAARQTEILQRAQEIQTQRKGVEAKRVSLEVRRRTKGELLASVQQEKGASAAALRELEESSAKLWDMVRKSEAEAPKSAAVSMPRSAATSSTDPDRLPWPLVGQILTRFGAQRHPELGTTVFRRGIEIEARQGADVKSVDAGRVAFADWYKGYGKLVILEHSTGLYTLYGHLSQLSVKQNDTVTRGQVIGLAGDTGSLKGSKLYFEIRRNGEAEDPLTWLARR